MQNTANPKAYIVTGPTSGIGRATALELAKYGMVVLVGRDSGKLDEVRRTIEKRNQHAVSVLCDLSDIESVHRAAAEIIALKLPIAGLLNNAGIMPMRALTNGQGWDLAFTTNYIGPFALTEALVPHLPDGANILFIGSAVENPEHKPARTAGFRGGRFTSVEASVHGEWEAGGSTHPGFDAYATSKQCILATSMALAREVPRLRFGVVEPGLTPATALGRDAGAVVRVLSSIVVPVLVPLFMPFVKVLSTPERAARMIAKILVDPSGRTGIYYDQDGQPMPGSTLARDPAFQDRVLAETRAFLSS